MPFATDIAGDYAIFDGGLTVTLTQQRGGLAVTASVRNAKYGPLTNRQINALGGVALTGKERSWSLNAGDVGTQGIEQGDWIDDGTNKWTVLSADLATLGNRWRCVTRMLPK